VRIAVAALLLAAAPGALERHEYTHAHMGTQVRIVLYASGAGAADAAADAAFARIAELDAALSDYRDSSELTRLSGQAGMGPVKISEDLFRVLRAAQQAFHASHGAFDVTVGPLTVLWRRARRLAELPDPQRVAAARDVIGGDNLILDGQQRTAMLVKPGMQLDLGGIAKGFAADEAAAVLARRGISAALVSVGGDIRVTDAPPGADGWRIAIAAVGGTGGEITLRHMGISTSGDAEQFVEIDGIRYSHIIDPRTGQPMTRRTSVTVVAPDATTTDAAATAVVVLGREQGLKLVDDTLGTAALITEAEAGRVSTYESSRWRTTVSRPRAVPPSPRDSKRQRPSYAPAVSW
jgi:thiamine biosynthesis lipoprotein